MMTVFIFEQTGLKGSGHQVWM